MMSSCDVEWVKWQCWHYSVNYCIQCEHAEKEGGRESYSLALDQDLWLYPVADLETIHCGLEAHWAYLK